MENDFPFEKPNKRKERTENKRYLAKKKRYQEKMAWNSSGAPEFSSAFLERSENVWRISEIKQGVSGKILTCFSQDWGILDLQIRWNDERAGAVVIGDYVSLRKEEIDGIIKRANLLARYKWDNNRFSLGSRILQPIAANLDYVVIVASAKDPKFQPWFIDRYMVLVDETGIPPIICITKSDLLPIDDPVLDWYENTLKVPVIHASSVSGDGIGALQEILRGKTVAFVGKSGVGKSSLTNALLGDDVITTSHVSEKWGQGRHTTTASKMHVWGKDSYVIDTPGIRSLEFLEFDREELKMYFPEFVKHSGKCQFRDCNHATEPICGIKSAVSEWKIPEFRYRTYLRLLSEVA